MPLGITTSLDFKNKIKRSQTANVYGVLRGQRSRSSQSEYVIYTRASRSSRRRRARCRRRQDLQRRDGQRVRRRAAARDRQGVQGAADAAEALDHAAVRRRGRAGPARLEVLRRASDDRARQDRREHQLRRRQHLGPRARTSSTSARASRRSTSTSKRSRSCRIAPSTPDQFPDRGFFYRSDQFNFAKIGVPALYLDTGTDFVGKPPELGQAAARGVREEALSPAVRRDSATAGTTTA